MTRTHGSIIRKTMRRMVGALVLAMAAYVPEPVVLALLAVGAAPLMRRRRTWLAVQARRASGPSLSRPGVGRPRGREREQVAG